MIVRKTQTKTQADGVFEMELSYKNPKFNHQISAFGLGRNGEVRLFVRPLDANDFEALEPASIDLSNPKTLVFNGFVEAVRIEPVGIIGNYTITYIGG